MGPVRITVTGGRIMLADFWGAAVRIHVAHERDEAHLAYYFEDFLSPRADRAATDVLLRSSRGSFVDAAPGATREVWTREPPASWRLYERYETTPALPTPLPPLGLAPLRATVTSAHASAATPPWAPEHGLVLHGASMVGKTVLLLELLRSGWGFVTDDTLVVRRRDRRLLRYCRPLGVREDTRRRLSWLPSRLEAAPKFDTPTGRTWCVSPRDLGAPIAPAETDWGWTVLLERAARLDIARLGPRSARIAFDVSQHAADVVAYLQDFAAMTDERPR